MSPDTLLMQKLTLWAAIVAMVDTASGRVHCQKMNFSPFPLLVWSQGHVMMLPTKSFCIFKPRPITRMCLCANVILKHIQLNSNLWLYHQCIQITQWQRNQINTLAPNMHMHRNIGVWHKKYAHKSGNYYIWGSKYSFSICIIWFCII